MKSIRVSLLGYFLLLLGVALAAVSGSVYRITETNLNDKQKTIQGLLEAKNKDRRQEEKAKFDEALLAQARTLASLAQFQFEWNRVRFQELFPLGLLTAGLNPNGHVTTPIWLVEGSRRGGLGETLLRVAMSSIQFDEALLQNDGQQARPEYFQINGELSHVWRSRSLADKSLPIDPTTEAGMKLFEWKFDDTMLEPGVPLRRVSLKSPVVRVEFVRQTGGERRPESRRDPKPPDPPREPKPPSKPTTERIKAPVHVFFIQSASTKGPLEDRLAELEEGLQSEVAELESRSKETLASLRNQLLLIGLATFAATVVGGFWLVRLGLSPLNRLSEAVSRVSEKDFRLPLEEGRLPGELRPIAARLTQTLSMLKRAFAREKQAAADISHELRTPLSALLTTLDLALRKPRSAEEYRELLQDCRVSGQHMNQLVERLLTLARLDAGVDMLRPVEVDAAGLADQCATLVRPLVEAGGLELRVHHPKPVLIKADPMKLREVLTNLLHNAIQYNRTGGTIDLTVTRENGRMHVDVADTGIGIDSEAKTHIFERFYRADPSRHADGLHAGLGLSIVKGYVDLMGGTISVDSTQGAGSTFRVMLPTRSERDIWNTKNDTVRISEEAPVG